MNRSTQSVLVRALAAVAVAGMMFSACTSGSNASIATTSSSADATATVGQASTAPSPSQVVPSASPADQASQVPLGSLTLKWQSGGPTTASVKSTWWPAVDPATSQVWVADPFDNQYWIFDAKGKYLESWGKAGSGDGEISILDHATTPDAGGAIAFAPDGSFYIGDTGNYRVEHFDKDRHFIGQWGKFGADNGQFGQIVGIATDGKHVYVGDGDRGDVQAFDADGRFEWVAPGGAGLIALDPTGNIYGSVQGSADVFELGAAGQQLGVLHVPCDNCVATGVAVRADGKLLVEADSPDDSFAPIATYELSPDGSVRHAWSQAGESIALSASGEVLYVAWTGGGGHAGAWDFIRAYALPPD